MATACKSPVQPVPSIQDRDTVHSVVSARITAPGMVNVLWELRTPADTLSVAAVTSTGDTTTKGVITSGEVYVFHNIRDDEPYISLNITKQFNIKITEIKREDNGKSVALRSWTLHNFDIYFDAPKNISAPFVPVNIRRLTWQQSTMSEYLVADGSGNAYLMTGEIARHTDIRYLLYYTNQPIYNCKIERAWLIIDKYDLTTKRVSGRFSLRAVSRIDSTVVDIQDGMFDNVYLQRYAN
jgi:hypothetical protein